jgi:hypothetical protein
MPYGTPSVAQQLEHGKFNRFLAALPSHDFALLAPHLRTIVLERGVNVARRWRGDSVAEESCNGLPHSVFTRYVSVLTR